MPVTTAPKICSGNQPSRSLRPPRPRRFKAYALLRDTTALEKRMALTRPSAYNRRRFGTTRALSVRWLVPQSSEAVRESCRALRILDFRDGRHTRHPCDLAVDRDSAVHETDTRGLSGSRLRRCAQLVWNPLGKGLRLARHAAARGDGPL